MPSGSSIFHKHSHRLCESWAVSVSFCDKWIIHYCFISEDSLRQATENTRSLPTQQVNCTKGLRGWKGTWGDWPGPDEDKDSGEGAGRGNGSTALPRTNLGMILLQLYSTTTTTSVVLNRGPSIVGGRSDWFGLDDKFTSFVLTDRSVRESYHKEPQSPVSSLSKRKGPFEMPHREGKVSPSKETMRWEEGITHWLTPEMSTVTPCFRGLLKLAFGAIALEIKL